MLSMSDGIRELLTDEQRLTLDNWLAKEVYPFVIAKQKEIYKNSSFAKQCWELGYPYEGASGGGLTYHFTPSGIGTRITISYGDYNLDITEYDSW